MNGYIEREIPWKIQYKEGIVFANSCNQRKCPCRVWAQCSKYNSKVWENLHPKQINKEIWDWYDICFRIIYEHNIV